MENLNTAIIGMIFTIAAVTTAAGGEVNSLRGENDLANDAKMYDQLRVINQKGGFERSWKTQPPSIPHVIEKDRINLDENTCMNCHSPEKFKEEKAVKIGDSHFLDASGAKSEKMNGRRYFCTQCHTPLKNTVPLVENTFKSSGN
ncbi:MAG: nitrate reductase cytochrome c-type subunit; periplasmic nitrate reductase electron transfer subunit [Bacteroidetes bacterium]|nr:nitrate reductase cytochrome c-type subunit; periplasmic nitrate reductase electron transfer subunit [Bacteroidota bacterium]